MPKFSDEFLNELRLRCDIEQTISAYTQLRRRGKNLVGLCPFHNEKTPSFTVYPDNQSFYCFGCGAGGDIVSFIRRIENLDYTEAVRYLCERCGMLMPTDGFDNTLAEKRKRMYEINREAARFFHDYLFSDEGKVGLDYYKMRGYKKSTLVRFGMGYAPDKWDGLLKYMRQKGYSYEELYEANLANRSTKNGSNHYYDSFRNRVMVPIIDVRGNVVAFGGRVLDDSKPKYVNTSDTLVYKKSLGVFGLNFAKSSKEKSLILVEGYMDAISLHQAGFTNTIACLGTALTSEMAHLLSRYCDEILLSYDADEAGQKATKRAIGIFNSIGMKLKVIKLSGGKDPDEILKKFGPERFQSLIDGAANDIEFALLRLRNDFDLETPDGRMKFLAKAAEILADTRNDIAIDIYSSKLAEEFSVNKDSILSQAQRIKKKKAFEHRKAQYTKIQQDSISNNSKLAIKNSVTIKVIKAEELLIANLVKSPDFFSFVKEEITADDFTDETNRHIFSALSKRIEESASLDLIYFSDELTDGEMNDFVRICKKDNLLVSTKKECLDCINVIKNEKNKSKGKIQPSQMNDDDFRKLFNKKKDS